MGDDVERLALEMVVRFGGGAARVAGGLAGSTFMREPCFTGAWTVCEQNQLLSVCFGLPQVNKA
jgi:hypothetical protein